MITAERTYQGAWVLTALLVGGYYQSMTYYGYTKAEALALFREQYRGQLAK